MKIGDSWMQPWKKRKELGSLFLGALFFFLWFLVACGQQPPVAEIRSPQGLVEFSLEENVPFVKAREKAGVPLGGAVRTGKESSVDLHFLSGTGQVSLRENAFFQVQSTSIIGKQMSGTAIYNIKKQEKEIHIETPHGNTTVLGTEFSQQISSSSLTLAVKTGVVEFAALGGDKRKVTAGEKLVFIKDSPLSEPTKMDLMEQLNLFPKNAGKANINQQ
jgi:hypothetical protein